MTWGCLSAASAFRPRAVDGVASRANASQRNICWLGQSLPPQKEAQKGWLVKVISRLTLVIWRWFWPRRTSSVKVGGKNAKLQKTKSKGHCLMCLSQIDPSREPDLLPGKVSLALSPIERKMSLCGWTCCRTKVGASRTLCWWFLRSINVGLNTNLLRRFAIVQRYRLRWNLESCACESLVSFFCRFKPVALLNWAWGGEFQLVCWIKGSPFTQNVYHICLCKKSMKSVVVCTPTILFPILRISTLVGS